MLFEQLVKQYNDIKAKIRRLVLKQQELRELGGLPRSGNYDGMPKAPGYNGSPIEKFIVKLDELEREQLEHERKLDALRNEITKYIDFIPNYTIRDIMEHRIFMGQGWRKISRIVNYSVSRVRQFYDEGILTIKSAGDLNEIR